MPRLEASVSRILSRSNIQDGSVIHVDPPRAGGPDAPIQLFDQVNDVAEEKNVAAEQPEIVAKIAGYLHTARTPLPEWEPRWQAGGKKKAAK